MKRSLFGPCRRAALALLCCRGGRGVFFFSRNFFFLLFFLEDPFPAERGPRAARRGQAEGSSRDVREARGARARARRCRSRTAPSRRCARRIFRAPRRSSRKALALGERADAVRDSRSPRERAQPSRGGARRAREGGRARPARPRVALALARSVETDPSASAAEKAARKARLAEIVARSPSNLPARLKLLVLEGEAGDARALSKGARRAGAARLATATRAPASFSPRRRTRSRRGRRKGATVKVRVLENVLRVTPRYQQSLGEVFTQVVGLPVERFSSKVEEGLRAGAGAAIPVSFRAPVASEENVERLAEKGGSPELRARPRRIRVPAPFTARRLLRLRPRRRPRRLPLRRR